MNNLGCFRILIANPLELDQVCERIAWLSEVLAELEDQPWRSEFWRAIGEFDADTLVQLTQDAAFEQRAIKDVVRLTRALFVLGERSISDTLDHAVQWHPFRETDEPSSRLTKLDDDSFLSSYQDGRGGNFEVRASVPSDPITAIRLETFLDERLPGQGTGHGHGDAMRRSRSDRFADLWRRGTFH